MYLLFFTSMLHGLVVESLSYVLPDIDNFWHAVSSVAMFRQRLPLHIFLFCELMEGGREGGLAKFNVL